LKFGVELGNQTTKDMIRISQLAEECGFNTIWVADHAPSFPWRDVFVSMAAIGQNTSSIRIGCGVCNPYSRHVGLTGVAVATLIELFGERILLGIGTGGTLPLKPLEIKMWEKPFSAIKESVQVLRSLFKGELVDFKGEIVKLRGVKLFSSFFVPIYIGTRGLALSKLAGEIADGVILNPPLGATQCYIEQIKMGLASSGRSKIDVVEFLPVVVSKNVNPVKPIVALLIPTTPSFALEMIGAKEQANMINEILKIDIKKAAELVTDNLVASFAVAGDVNHCISQIEALEEAGVDELVALSFGSLSSILKMIRIFGEKIIPSF